MKKIEEYYIPSMNLNNCIDSLSDKGLDFKKHRDDVNLLIINTVIKYLTSYLNIKSGNISNIKEQIGEIMDSKRKVANSEILENGMIHEKNHLSNEMFGLKCALDIQQTSAILKEIIFGKFENINEGTFKSIDLGSGSGILSHGAIIAGQRNGYQKGVINLFDLSKESLQNSKKVLEEINSNYKIEDNLGNMLEGNFKKIGTPNMWLSETIGMTTPSFSFDREDGEVIPHISTGEIEARNFTKTFMSADENLVDPFLSTFEKSIKEIPNFIENIENGKTFMFPNSITKKYIPNQENSSIQFDTFLDGGKLLLGDTGGEFKDFEALTKQKTGRWDNQEIKKESFEEIARVMFGTDYESLKEIFSK